MGSVCGGVARESACDEFHKRCEVVDRAPLSEDSDDSGRGELYRPRVSCVKTVTQESRRVRIVPMEKMPRALRVAGEESSGLVQGQAGGQRLAV